MHQPRLRSKIGHSREIGVDQMTESLPLNLDGKRFLREPKPEYQNAAVGTHCREHPYRPS